MTLMIEWHDEEVTEGADATEVLGKLLHGWNPSTLPELKVVLARRAVIAPPTNDETDLQFLQRLHNAGVLTLRQ